MKLLVLTQLVLGLQAAQVLLLPGPTGDGLTACADVRTQEALRLTRSEAVAAA
jgi:hypothetical protein